MLNAHLAIFCFGVLGFLSSFSFVWIDPSRCNKKKLSTSILILISNFLRQMRYRWNRHYSYIVNIVFLNNLVQKQTFLYFAFSSSLGTKARHWEGSLSTVRTSRNATVRLFWPRVQLQILISRVVDRVCKSSASIFFNTWVKLSQAFRNSNFHRINTHFTIFNLLFALISFEPTLEQN